MNDIIENIRVALYTTGEFTELILNSLSLLCIVAGVILAFKTSLQKRLPGDHPLHTNFRMRLGGWLVVSLEFQLAADIVGTIVSPTTGHLVELGVIAVIRTFLNYFLSKELLEEKGEFVFREKHVEKNEL